MVFAVAEVREQDLAPYQVLKYKVHSDKPLTSEGGFSFFQAPIFVRKQQQCNTPVILYCTVLCFIFANPGDLSPSVSRCRPPHSSSRIIILSLLLQLLLSRQPRSQNSPLIYDGVTGKRMKSEFRSPYSPKTGHLIAGRETCSVFTSYPLHLAETEILSCGNWSIILECNMAI